MLASGELRELHIDHADLLLVIVDDIHGLLELLLEVLVLRHEVSLRLDLGQGLLVLLEYLLLLVTI